MQSTEKKNVIKWARPKALLSIRDNVAYFKTQFIVSRRDRYPHAEHLHVQPEHRYRLRHVHVHRFRLPQPSVSHVIMEKSTKAKIAFIFKKEKKMIV